MSKKTALITIAIVALVIFGGLLIYFHSENPAANTSEQSATSTVNPFGVEPAEIPSSTTTANTGGNTSQTTNTVGQSGPHLVQVYANPTSGSVFLASSTDVLQFVDRGNGNVYQYLPQMQLPEAIRLTNTTIPKIEETVWSSLGNDLVYRYLDNDSDTIDSFSGVIAEATSSGNLGSVTGAFLDQNIADIVSDPKGDKIFSLMEKTDGSGSYGSISNFDGTNQKQVFTSPASFWNVSWPTNSIIAFTTKPTYKDYGYLYFENTATNSFQKILGSMTGLSTLVNTDASLVAYSQSENNSFDLGIYDVTNGTQKAISIATLADKCVWSIKNTDVLYCAVPQSIPSDNYPDAWYQGTESFSDNIWMINADTGVTTELYQIGSHETASIDAEGLSISPDDKYLAFTNKDDLSLWILSTGN